MRLDFPCCHLPESITAELDYQTLTFENRGRSLELNVPRLTGLQLSETMDLVRQRRNHYLAGLRVNDIVRILDEAVQLWLNPSFEWRRLAEEMLPVITGYDSEMVRLFLSRYLRQFRKEKLLRMIDEDFSNPLVLDEFRPRRAGGLTRAYGPDLITHIFSGNVPALPLWSMVSGLLVKSATLGKVSSSEPLFPVLFTKTLEQIDPELAGSIAIAWWKGGNQELEESAFHQSEAVIVYGGEQTTTEIAKRIPSHVRYFVHGHKVSFGVITKECLDGSLAVETAKLAAQDASWFDQQGCLSPHVFYVEEGGKISPRDFARLLAHEMASFEHKMPRAVLTAEEKNAIQKVRSQAEFQSFQDEGIELLSSKDSTAWTVVYREQAEFPFPVLNRVVSVVPIGNIDEVANKIKSVRRVVQTVGVACPPQKFHSLIQILGEHGVNRICALGEMPKPEPGWHHDGRLSLADLVRWCDVEASVVACMDRYDPYRD